MMKKRTLHITEYDMQRLRKIIGDVRNWDRRDREYLDYLEKELDDAVLVPSDQMPVDFVTLNTRMRVRDLDSNDEESIQLVFPSDANFREGKISILTPVGTALIGYRAGDTVEWRIPSGTRRLRIEEIIYQPEAEGLF
ncbi:MAG: nucleoside diphosphate kinase regulator [Acidobacteria bacterium]|nr:nucleoside diphosphate kinase regulator [Acidobacteriota bacterium]